MNPAEIVVHVMECDRVFQIREFFAKRIGQSRKAAHLHSHSQILALNVARGNVLVIGQAVDYRLPCPHAHCGAIPSFWRVLRSTVNLLKLRVVDLRSEYGIRWGSRLNI